MTAAAPLALRDRPAKRWRASREELLDLLYLAREEIADADAALAMALASVHYLCSLRAPPRPADHRAERRVLGAMLLGRATLSDVRELEPGDFDGPGHAALFAVLSALSEIAAAPPPAVLGLPRLARATGGAARAERERYARAVLTTWPGGAVDALAALDDIPWPAGCPRREIAKVIDRAEQRRGL